MFWVTQKVSALELLDGTLKFRHCTTLFTMRFLPWSLPRVGNGDGKRQFIAPGLLSEASCHMGKRIRLAKKTRPGVLSNSNPDPVHPTPRRWKRLHLPSSERVGVKWVRFALGMPGTYFRRQQAQFSPAEGARTLVLAHF